MTENWGAFNTVQKKGLFFSEKEKTNYFSPNGESWQTPERLDSASKKSFPHRAQEGNAQENQL